MVKHSNNSSAVADELFECVRPFCGVGAQKVELFFSSFYNAARNCKPVQKSRENVFPEEVLGKSV